MKSSWSVTELMARGEYNGKKWIEGMDSLSRGFRGGEGWCPGCLTERNLGPRHHLFRTPMLTTRSLATTTRRRMRNDGAKPIIRNRNWNRRHVPESSSEKSFDFDTEVPYQSQAATIRRVPKNRVSGCKSEYQAIHQTSNMSPMTRG